ncbi:uroporphyrinogen-III synthase [Marinobacter halophilus]|uniref:Uroporphyrinogen-III synthase n=1 Tax=Marinobacter halophilus TaxID=1323740 RepID=A0A2T1KKS2_9GAMM|nr:uroporphyrinogen-III synthase [Marinobacter halophilus]PSF10323.1 uroporphyrinogen III synthase [Marinobacter halophilus]GGC69746.1 uroporphyrinogen-III synthase [Marinobacter halophilus]
MVTPPADHDVQALPLQGRRILICRPEPEASRLAEVFRSVGANVRLMPLVTREPLPETPERRALLQELNNFRHIIAVSPYAAKLLLDEIEQWWPQMPMGLQWYGVGAGTAAVFSKQGLRPRRPTQGWTSEALLALPSLQQLEHEKVLLARGEQGRELIRETLEQRGARISVLPLYRRFRPYYPPEQVQDNFDRFQPEVIIALSGETLNNLIEIGANYHQTLYHALLVVPAERIAEQARSAGFSSLLVPDGLADVDLVTSVASRLVREAGNNGKPSKDARD